MNRHDYATLLDRVAEHGVDTRLQWLSGRNAGRWDPWEAGKPAPGAAVRGLGGSLREAPEGQVFAETLVGVPRLVIVGGGHVGVAFARVAVTLGFDIVVIDERPEFADAERFPGVDRVLCGPYAETLASLPDYANSYYVLVTPGHRQDAESALAALSRPFAYAGMIGSKGKVANVRASLQAAGVAEDVIGRLRAPIGLDLGGREPAEIAIAIAAEIIMVRSGRGDHVFDPEVAASVRQLAAEPDREGVLATIVGHAGSVPRGTSSRMLVGPDGPLAGSVGGGAVEAATIDRGRALLAAARGSGARAKASETAVHDFEMSATAELGMICGGRVRVFFERL